MYLAETQKKQYEDILQKMKMIFDQHTEQNINDIARHTKQLNFLNDKLNDHISSNAIDLDKLGKRVHILEDAPANESHASVLETRQKIKFGLIGLFTSGGIIGVILGIIKLIGGLD
jgi:hypothetical protein